MTSHPLAYYHPRSVEPLRPPNPFLSFYRQANRMFEDIFREFDEAREALGGTFTPNVDVTQDDHQIRITAELPGIREEDIDVSIKNDLLTIRAEKRVEQDGAGENRQVKERAFGKFERTFRRPEAVEPDRIRAHFTHGHHPARGRPGKRRTQDRHRPQPRPGQPARGKCQTAPIRKGPIMKTCECMTREVRIMDPAETLQDAARMMMDIDAGFLPVGENDRIVGIITDRDIAIRGVGKGMAPDTRIRDVMSKDVRYCYEDEEVEQILYNMGEQQIRRLPVVDRDKRLVGVISITDLAAGGEIARSGAALREITRSSGLHSQGDSTRP